MKTNSPFVTWVKGVHLPIRIKLLAFVISMFMNHNAISQATVISPTWNEPYVTAVCTTEYAKLNADVCLFAGNYRVTAFVNDAAGTNGDELLFTVVDWNSNVYQFPITANDLNNNYAYAFGPNATRLYNPDVTLLESTSFSDGVMAVVVFDTDDPTYGAFVVQFTVTLTGTGPYGISFVPFSTAEPVNYDGFSTFGYAQQPKIDGDHQTAEFAIASVQPYGMSSQAVFTSYYSDLGGFYTVNPSYLQMLASIPVANYIPVNPDIAVGDDIVNTGLESVVTYLNVRPGYLTYMGVARMPNGSTTPSLEYYDYINSSTAAIGDDVNYPRICCDPHFDPTFFPMEWEVAISCIDPTPANHLRIVHSDSPLIPYYPDDWSFNTYGTSLNYMPALDWMDAVSPNSFGDGFVAWQGDIDVGVPTHENGVYGMMNPYFTMLGNNYDWYQVNNIGTVPIKNQVAVASDPDYAGYVTAWYDQQQYLYYKIMAMNNTSFKPDNIEAIKRIDIHSAKAKIPMAEHKIEQSDRNILEQSRIINNQIRK